MEKLKTFNYNRMKSRWGKFNKKTGERISDGACSDALLKRAMKIVSIIMWKIDFDITLNDLPDIYWPDRLYYIHNDEDLFERIQLVLSELIDEIHWTKKDKRNIINAINDLCINKGEIKKYEFDFNF